jgi:hypothetical protein
MCPLAPGLFVLPTFGMQIAHWMHRGTSICVAHGLHRFPHQQLPRGDTGAPFQQVSRSARAQNPGRFQGDDVLNRFALLEGLFDTNLVHTILCTTWSDFRKAIVQHELLRLVNTYTPYAHLCKPQQYIPNTLWPGDHTPAVIEL